MKLYQFKELDRKKRMVVMSGVGVLLLVSAIFLYRSYAIYQEEQRFNVIKGSVPNQDYDVFLSYYLIGDNGEKTFMETMPQGRGYKIDIQCDKGALGTWNYETWGPTIYNLEQSRTKCKLFFSNPEETFVNKIQSLPKVSTGDGLYEVSHSYAEINYTAQIPAKEALKQTEYRFAGTDPNEKMVFVM